MRPVPKIPGYELLQFLGGGPLTSVFAGQERATGAACAVKIVREDWADPITAVKLLQREARAGLSVRHPYLVKILDAHVTRPPYFLVMEMLPGESLRSRLRRDYRLDTATALWITRQSAEALAALHRVGFIHGDVKPENIRLVDDGTAVLIDLGFAHRPGENAALLQDGYVLGTANYLAPELCAFKPEKDQSSDMFSLGITLFEMLTGRLPYPSGSLNETMQRHLNDSPADIRSYGFAIPESLASLVDRLLARQPTARPRAAAVVQQFISLEIITISKRRSA